MTALMEKVLAQVAQYPDEEQEAIAARMLQTLSQYQQEKQASEKPRPQFGSAKGMIWMSEDFDAPLEEFKDYM